MCGYMYMHACAIQNITHCHGYVYNHCTTLAVLKKKTHFNYFMNVDIPWISIVTVATVLTVVTNVW